MNNGDSSSVWVGYMNQTNAPIIPLLQRFVLVLLVAGTVACGSDGPVQIEFTEPPEISAGPNPNVPLVATLAVATSPSTRIEIMLTDGGDHSFMVESSGSASIHNIPILGMKAGRTYEVRIAALFGGSRSDWTEVLSWDTPPLPDDFPPLQVLVSDPDAMEPGFTLFNIRPAVGDSRMLVIVDEIGDVVWYADDNVGGATVMLDNGNLLTARTTTSAWMEYTLLGESVSAWASAQGPADPAVLPGDIPVDIFQMHHDVFAMPSGNFLSVAHDNRTVDNFPTDQWDPSVRETQRLLGDPLVEYQSDGTVVEVWHQLDLLNPTRIGYGSNSLIGGAADWGHGNAVWYDPVDDAILTSLRNQDAVIKYSRATGELVWILGNHANWEGFEQYLLSPIGSPFEWQWHQHAPMVTSAGTVLLYDNANFSASPFTGAPTTNAADNYSRAVEYRIDEDAMTVEQVWEWGLPQSG